MNRIIKLQTTILVMTIGMILASCTQAPHPIFWGMVSFIAVICLFVLAPFQYWLQQHGWNLQSGLTMEKSLNNTLPKLRNPGIIITTSFAIIGQLS